MYVYILTLLFPEPLRVALHIHRSFAPKYINTYFLKIKLFSYVTTVYQILNLTVVLIYFP